VKFGKPFSIGVITAAEKGKMKMLAGRVSEAFILT
jgi:hypothetical protein